ncbi:MAG: helix-turn-helix transcriptional regulator [Paludibacteraceae bacterium]|nr:helix-turn-helix transcriptional regulator [Paludibacteraceae bacterium]MBO7316015.1 helix-turn-helix transcriptional regulator [Paludibacteraceae bacterium]
MNKQIEQIAERIHGLRDSMDYSVEEMANICETSVADYEKYESGKSDIPMSFICHLASKFNINPSELISGTEAYMSTYFLTRKGKGASVERTKAYKYQALANGFRNAKADPFEVTVEPNNDEIHLNRHAGQEFNMILEGQMQLRIGNSDLVLNEGDSIYFDATQPHGMKALNNQKVRFLAIIVE